MRYKKTRTNKSVQTTLAANVMGSLQPIASIDQHFKSHGLMSNFVFGIIEASTSAMGGFHSENNLCIKYVGNMDGRLCHSTDANLKSLHWYIYCRNAGQCIAYQS